MIENVPNFEDMKVVDEDGNWTPAWKNIMSQLISFLQQNYSKEGLFVPQKSAADITTLSTTKSVGAILYDSTTNTYRACIPTGPFTAIFKTINLI